MSAETWQGLVVQLVRCTSTMDRPAAWYQPNPPGQPMAGSASDAVLALLQAHKGAPLRKWQIVRRVNRSQKAVGWALEYLRAVGRIEALPDSHPRYLRYRVKKGAPDGR